MNTTYQAEFLCAKYAQWINMKMNWYFETAAGPLHYQRFAKLCLKNEYDIDVSLSQTHCYWIILKKEVSKVIGLQVLNTYRIFTWKRKQTMLLMISDKKAFKTVESGSY